MSSSPYQESRGGRPPQNRFMKKKRLKMRRSKVKNRRKHSKWQRSR